MITLSEAQRQVVEYDEGPMLVVAGPGSGKTRVLTEWVRRVLTTTAHYRVLALTFTNKAAREMEGRLADLGDLRKRAFIGTMHSFCLEILADRGKPVGVLGTPALFERQQDRKAMLLQAVQADPRLVEELEAAGDAKDQAKRLDDWLNAISWFKTHPLSRGQTVDELTELLVGTYDQIMRSSGVYDYDDLLSLAYKLLTEFPQVAEFYRRLYGYICLDEAQDLNEGQYAVIQALCGPAFRNILLVGDPKQSIYGFNKSSPELMERFAAEFDARRFDLTANFRSSQAVVDAAQALDPAYKVFGSLPIAGELGVIVGSDEADEARQIVAKLKSLSSGGHPALESGLRLDRCAILGRTRYALLATESALREEALPYYRLLSSAFENESELVGDLMLGLRLASNPRDGLHLRELAERWGGDRMSADELVGSDDVVTLLSSRCSNDRCAPVVGAIRELTTQPRLDLPKALAHLTSYADTLPDTERQTVYNDVKVLVDEWDRYLRSGNPANRSIPGFLSSMALGTTRQPGNEGVGLLTVHAAKGLEFDVVFVVGLADGIFPDYRASKSQKAAAEERRNAFVAVTRATRLLYLSFPKTRTMPWGDVWQSKPSPFLEEIVKKASG